MNHQLLEKVGKKVLDAFNIIKDNGKEHFNISLKSKNDAVTNIDLALQSSIVDIIREFDSETPIISEENFTDHNDKETAWIIDPLDGTSNFIQKLNPIAVSIAKVAQKEVLYSVVIDLFSSDIYTAVKNKGARLNQKKLPIIKENIKLIGLSTGYLNKGGNVPDGYNARILGSQALHLCLVASGALSASLNYESKAWDDVAGSLIIKEAGFFYSNNYSSLYNWSYLASRNNSLQSVASNNKKLHEELKKIMDKTNV